MGSLAGICTCRDTADAAVPARQAGSHVLPERCSGAAAVCILHSSGAVPQQQCHHRQRQRLPRSSFPAVLQSRSATAGICITAVLSTVTNQAATRWQVTIDLGPHVVCRMLYIHITLQTQGVSTASSCYHRMQAALTQSCFLIACRLLPLLKLCPWESSFSSASCCINN